MSSNDSREEPLRAYIDQEIGATGRLRNLINIVLVLNHYQQPGGEAYSTDSETRVLSSAGHRVVEYVRYNEEIAGYNLWQKATLGLRTVWAGDRPS
jgi:hypothetical protein